MIIRRLAERDIDEIIDWYEEQQVGLGGRFHRSLERVLDQIERLPELYRVNYQQVRRALIPRFPIAIYYRIEEREAVVLAVMHSRRDPNRWKSRI